jgi:catechol 2,3-dioxygenase-like lactoylglutathione lyase family enzyme
MRLNQVTVPTTDIPRSVEFYTRLGLIQIVDSDDYARFECPDGDSTFSIHQVDRVLTLSDITIYFECDDLDAKVELLQESGMEFTSEPADMTWLWREARVLDPDGNEICLFHAGENRLNPPWRLSSN